MRSGSAVLLFIALVAAGCASAESDVATMSRLASDLTRLSRAVDAYVSSTANLPTSDKEIIEAATAHDPDLRKPFERYQLRVAITARDSAVLVCSADGRRLLLEDAGCTAKVEHRPWQEVPLPPCASTLDLTRVCRKQ